MSDDIAEPRDDSIHTFLRPSTSPGLCFGLHIHTTICIFYNHSIATTRRYGVDASDCSKRFGRRHGALLRHSRDVIGQSGLDLLQHTMPALVPTVRNPVEIPPFLHILQTDGLSCVRSNISERPSRKRYDLHTRLIKGPRDMPYLLRPPSCQLVSAAKAS